jgi:peptidoglycan-N-acetylglucosamine deacetylase
VGECGRISKIGESNLHGRRLTKSLLAVAACLLLALLLPATRPSPAPAAEPVIVWGGPPQVRQVALTFDDGPSPRATGKILALLNQYGAQATFFVLGDHLEEYPGLVQTEIRDGEEVGNHSFDHPRFPRCDMAAQERELERTQVDLDLLGYHPAELLFRPPYSDYNQRLVAYLGHTRRRLVLWGIDSGDWQGLSAETIAHNVLDRVRPGAIIIFHDSDERERANRTPTIEALKVILPALKAAGYRMVTISELIAGAPPGKRP